mmetsp:Transcript_2733/g.4789  ORF Transcript_2733/g.4789 Transcript_2733/m.4789 type:complete len:206 (+) Transcript_2733:238-855(+)
MASTKPITAPTKGMPWEEFYKTTDNANKLMNRVWYCIAATDKAIGDEKIFWEHWYWNDNEESKDLAETKKNGPKKASNHTLTISATGKEVDYPIWPLKFTSDSMKMYPAIDLKCMVIAPIGLSMQPVAFPTEDSPTEFRVDYCEAMGKKMYFVFVLDPSISEDDKKKNFELLEKENGVLREWFHEVQWEADYEIGSAGEPDINPK